MYGENIMGYSDESNGQLLDIFYCFITLVGQIKTNFEENVQTKNL